MRANGTLQIAIEPAEGAWATDAYGEPMDAEQAWTDPVPCAVTGCAKLTRCEDGEMHQATYSVFLESSLLEGTDPESVSAVRVSRRGRDLGEFRVISAEVAETLGRVVFTV